MAQKKSAAQKTYRQPACYGCGQRTSLHFYVIKGGQRQYVWRCPICKQDWYPDRYKPSRYNIPFWQAMDLLRELTPLAMAQFEKKVSEGGRMVADYDEQSKLQSGLFD